MIAHENIYRETKNIEDKLIMQCDNGKWKLWVWLTIPIQIESQSLKELRSARMFDPSVKCQARWGPNWNYIVKSDYDPVDLESIGYW